MYTGRLNEIIDDGKLWNHSETPNTGLPPGDGPEYDAESTYSVRDIKAGEEFLDDYGLYNYPDWYRTLCAEYSVDRSFVTVKETPPGK